MRKTKALLVASLVWASSCSTGPNTSDSVVEEQVRGTVDLLRAHGGATVVAYEFRDGRRGPEIGRAETATDGRFELTGAVFDGDMEVCATGGTSEEPISGVALNLTTELCSIVLQENGPDDVSDVALHPWGHIATALAKSRISAGESVPSAIAAANAAIAGYLGCPSSDVAIVTGRPVDLFDASNAPFTQSSSLRLALSHAGLAQQAARLSASLNFTPGTRITLVSLMQALADDVGFDGTFDGLAGGQISLDGYVLTSQTLRSDPLGFPQSIRVFLESPENTTGLPASDVDDLLACQASFTGDLFEGGGGGVLDTAPPAVTWVSPVDGAVVTGAVAISATVSDASRLESVEFVDSPVLDPVISLNGPSATVTGTFDAAPLEDGTYTLTLRSRDVAGNSGDSTVEVTLDRNAPVITIVSPTGGAPLVGTAQITAEVTDAEGVASVRLISPELSNVTTNSDNTFLTVPWDTTLGPDGAVLVVVEATDTLGNTATASVSVEVDNLAPSEVAGNVRLDTAVTGGEVSAYDFSGFTRGIFLASDALDDEGHFEIALPDSQRGPVLLEVSGTMARYTSVVTGAVVQFESPDRLSTVFVHEPTATGSLYDPIHINGVTTLASALAAKYAADGDETPMRAFELFAEYLRNDDPIDLQTTLASDLTANAQADPDPAHRLGLFHASIARLGAEQAEALGLALSRLPTNVMLRLLVRDISSGMFNGLDDSGTPIIPVTLADPLSSYTLRVDAALAGVRFLDAEPIGALAQSNATGLTAANFFGPGTFLYEIALNDSELFPASEPPVSPDISPPGVVVELINGLAQPLPETEPVPAGAWAAVRVTANDESGVPTAPTVVIAPGPQGALDLEPPGATLVAGPTQTLFIVPVSQLDVADGLQSITATAVDAAGNEAFRTIEFIIDNTPPSVTVATPARVSSSPITATITVDDAYPVTLEVFVNGGLEATLANVTGTVTPSLPVSCTAQSNIQVRATDTAGNASSLVSSTTICDDTPPSIVFSRSLYEQETQEGITNLSATSFDVVLGPEVFLDANPIIEKIEGRLNARDNPPILNYAVTDPGSFGDAPEDISLSYTFTGCASRPARNISPQSDGTYELMLIPDALDACLLTANESQTQTVTFTARDSLGNTATRAYTFRLKLHPVPIVLLSCGFDSRLEGVNYNNLNTVFDGADRLLYQATVAWPYPADQPYAFAPPRLTVSGGSFETNRRRVDEYLQGSPTDYRWRLVGSHGSVPRFNGCGRSGSGELNGATRRKDILVNAISDRDVDSEFRDGAQPISPVATNTWELIRGRPYTAGVLGDFGGNYVLDTSEDGEQWRYARGGASNVRANRSFTDGEGFLVREEERAEFTCIRTFDLFRVNASSPTYSASRGGQTYPIEVLPSSNCESPGTATARTWNADK